MKFQMVDPERISFGKINPRQDIGDIDNMVNNMRQRLEEGKRPIVLPLLARRIESETHDWEIVDGKRRLQSALRLRLPEIPVVDETDVKDPIELKFMSRTSNQYRKDLEWWEDADFYIDMNENDGLSFREIARRLGVDESTVRRKVHARKLLSTYSAGTPRISLWVAVRIDETCPEEEIPDAIIHAIEEEWTEQEASKNIFAMRNFKANQEVARDFHPNLYNYLQKRYHPWRFNPKFMALYEKEKTLKMGELGLIDYYLDIGDYPTRESANEYAKNFSGEVIGPIHRDGWHLRILPYNSEELDKQFKKLLEKFS